MKLFLKPWRSYLLMLICVLFAFGLRMYLASNQAFEIAEQAMKDGKKREALDEYQYAMRAYAPFLSTPWLAANQLKVYADEQIKMGNRHEALMALDRLRGGILSTRSFYMPFEDLLPDCNEKIAQLRSKEAFELQQKKVDLKEAQTLEALLKHHRALLTIIPGPTPLGSIWVSLSWLGWILFSILSIFKGFDRQLKIVDGRYLIVAVVFCVSWLLALKFV